MIRQAFLKDKSIITDLIHRERLARDGHDWETMAACYDLESSVDISWFKGSGAGFVAASRAARRAGNLNFHILQPMTVEVDGDRALAEMPCTLRGFSVVGGVETSLEGFVRLLWRVERSAGDWLIAGLRVIYVRDMLLACNPGEVPRLDAAVLAQSRPSYRFLAYQLRENGLIPRDDLPGMDRPDLVAALRDGERQWLTAG